MTESKKTENPSYPKTGQVEISIMFRIDITGDHDSAMEELKHAYAEMQIALHRHKEKYPASVIHEPGFDLSESEGTDGDS